MLGLLKALESVSALGPSRFLQHIGSATLAVCRGGCGEPSAIVVGFGAHGLLSAVLGILYAASQQRVPARGLVAVGVFFGVLLWVISGLIMGPIFGETVRRDTRSWPWFLACVVYGVSLAAAALWVEAHRTPGPSDVVQPD